LPFSDLLRIGYKSKVLPTVCLYYGVLEISWTTQNSSLLGIKGFTCHEIPSNVSKTGAGPSIGPSVWTLTNHVCNVVVQSLSLIHTDMFGSVSGGLNTQL